MKYRFSKLPVHWIMLPVFFVLHPVNEYYGLLSSKIVFRYMWYYILLAVLLLAGGRLLFKSYKKSAVWTTTLLLVFFSWGAVHDFLKGLGLPSFFTSYSLLLPILFIFLLFLSWLLWKRDNIDKSTIFLNLVFSVLIIVDLAQIAYKYLSPVDENDLSRNNPPLQINIKPIPDSLKPDIFFIVFDEYASSLSLKKYLNFDNHALDSMMKSSGFYVAGKAKSNYNATPLSVSSTFNMQYFQEIYEGYQFDAVDLQRAWYTLKKSFIPDFLRKNKYDIITYSIDSTGEIAPAKFNGVVQEEIFWGHTLLACLQKDIFWNFYSIAPFLRPHNHFIEQHTWEKRNIRNLFSEIGKNRNKPRFVYVHLMLPHSPFCLDRNGKFREYSEMEKESGEAYLEQVLYSNKLIEDVLVFAKRITTPLVMIIQGDHGYRDRTPVKANYETKFMNLSTYYFSDHDYRLLYDSISPVNTFRVILNKYFNTNIPLLRDSTTLIKYKVEY